MKGVVRGFGLIRGGDGRASLRAAVAEVAGLPDRFVGHATARFGRALVPVGDLQPMPPLRGAKHARGAICVELAPQLELSGCSVVAARAYRRFGLVILR